VIEMPGHRGHDVPSWEGCEPVDIRHEEKCVVGGPAVPRKCSACGDTIEVGTAAYWNDGWYHPACFMIAQKPLKQEYFSRDILHGKPEEADDAGHFDTDKPELQWLPFGPLADIARVFQYGAGKYGRGNYQKGMKWSKLIGSALRHLYAFMDGEDKDPESGLSHIAHAGANVIMLLYTIQHYPQKDDRKNLI